MNNSKLAIDSVGIFEEPKVDTKPYLREREGQLLKIIEAIQGVNQSGHWGTLKTELFDTLVDRLENQLKDEGKKENPDSNKLNRLAGQLKWAEKYSDLTKLENVFRVELTSIRKQLHATE